MLRYAIVGGGVAGHRAALALRRHSPDSEIVLLGAEPGLPYDRPPLTKAFLLGSLGEHNVTLPGAADYSALGIGHRPTVRVEAIDRRRQLIKCGHAGEVAYDRLLLATGSRPRKLPRVAPSPHVHYLRTLADAVALRRRLAAGGAIAVIGGGFIGLEIAAAARTRGCDVTVVEAADRLLARGLPPLLSRFVHALHEANGVEIALNTAVGEVYAHGHDRLRIELPGQSLIVDDVVVGVGIIPNTELALACELEVQDGIVVDRACRTSDPAIFAAGEVTSHPSGRHGRLRRVESWRAAAEQSLVAAANMSGSDLEYDDPPWLWSDQYDINLQVIGQISDTDEHILHGDPASRRWTLVSLDPDGIPLGAVAVNNGRDISMLRAPIRDGKPVPAALGKAGPHAGNGHGRVPAGAGKSIGKQD